MAITDYLNKLVQLKNELIAILRNKGVEVANDEKLNTLVPKVDKQGVVWVDDTSRISFAGSNIGTSSAPDYYNNLSQYFKKIVLPQGIKSIGNYGFRAYVNLTEIIIPDSVTSIGTYVFYGCTGLINVIIGSGLTSIGNRTFYGCTGLTNVTLANGITSIGTYAFYNCKSLANIYYTGTEEQWNAISKGSSWNTNMGSNVEGGTVIHYNYVPE